MLTNQAYSHSKSMRKIFRLVLYLLLNSEKNQNQTNKQNLCSPSGVRHVNNNSYHIDIGFLLSKKTKVSR